MKTLKLTSPYMAGPDVTRTQTAMIKQGWLKDRADGVYGPMTAQAAYRSKYWLGYATPDQIAGDLLLAYLEGRRQPMTAMTKLAARRKQEAVAVPLRQKALDWLAGHIGEKEQPAGSNRVPWASDWYGIGPGPWCAMAVTRAYVEAGSTAFARGRRYAYVPFIVNDAHAGTNHLAITTDPQPGDLVCFDWDGGVADHIGLFVKWADTARSQLESVEGNTSSGDVGSQSNGGMVARRQRSRPLVQAFVHVGA